MRYPANTWDPGSAAPPHRPSRPGGRERSLSRFQAVDPDGGTRPGGDVGSTILLLTNARQPDDVLPALELLLHDVRAVPAQATALLDAPSSDCILVDARRDLGPALGLTRLLRTTGVDAPLIAVVTEGGLAAVTADWGIDDVLLNTAGPAEVEARLRLATGRLA